MVNNSTTELMEERIREIVREEIEAWQKLHILPPAQAEAMVFNLEKQRDFGL
jgi:hypothetical protein